MELRDRSLILTISCLSVLINKSTGQWIVYCNGRLDRFPFLEDSQKNYFSIKSIKLRYVYQGYIAS